MSARSWTIEDTGVRPLTVNKVVNMHRMAWADHTAQTRADWTILAMQAKVPRLDACTITVTPLHKDRRSPQDCAACAPHAKAGIDGVVDAGVLPDDDASHLLAVTFLPPEICGRDGMRLTITEATR